MKRILSNPHAAVVVASLVLVVTLAVIFGTIGGSYALMVHYVSSIQASQKATQAKSAMGLCRAIQQMDLAGVHASFSSGASSAYGRQLSSAIHQLYVSSGCSVLINRGG
jgi:hypothetical protein